MAGRPTVGIFALLVFAAPVSGETVRLIGGGQVHGRVLAEQTTSTVVVVQTPDGGVVAIDRTHVEQVVPPSAVEQEYYQLRDQSADTVADHLRLAEWCTKHRLPHSRRAHLRRILQIEPDHPEARRLLGYIHREGGWVTQEELRLAQGYVRYRGRWRLPQEIELMERRREQRQVRGQWHRQIEQWHQWLSDGDREHQRRAWEKLGQIDDPNAIPPLEKILGQDPDDRVRLLLIRILAQIPGEDAVEALVVRSLADRSAEVRWEAVQRLAEDRPREALPHYIRALSDEENRMVRRAAAALGELGEPSAVEPLIDALVTRHRVDVPAPEGPGAIGIGMIRPEEGSNVFDLPQQAAQDAITQVPLVVPFASGTALSLGRSQSVVTVEIQNNEALLSLIQLTDQNFGFNKDAWKSWWMGVQELRDAPAVEQP